MDRCRFAPTTSGPAHPGTLLAALLCWLDARSRDASVALRLEDVDPDRCTPESARDMRDALDWLGLDWDACHRQSDHRDRHEAALDALEQLGALYPCGCSRSQVKQRAIRAADGGFRYPGTCRPRALPAGGWREAGEPLRLRLPAGVVAPVDEGGMDLSQDPAQAMGDPVVLRRDGSVAYHLACVVDDGAEGVTRVVRGRDLAPCTAIHVVLQGMLGLPTPTYRHHLLLLEPDGDKLAKLHGSVGWRELRAHYDAGEACGLLAHVSGLRSDAGRIAPFDLVDAFDWNRVVADDVPMHWTGESLDRM